MKKLYALLLLSLVALAAPFSAMASCDNCGRVTNIDRFEGHRNTTGGAVAGAVVGGLLGNQVGGGDGKKLATVAGAVGGAYAGKEIAKNSERTKYKVTVRMDQGYSKTVTQNSVNGIQIGTRVKVRNGKAVRL
jgi:outer membrane lipoprotein SlyB